MKWVGFFCFHNCILYRDEWEVAKFSNTKAVEVLVNSKLNVGEQENTGKIMLPHISLFKAICSILDQLKK